MAASKNILDSTGGLPPCVNCSGPCEGCGNYRPARPITEEDRIRAREYGEMLAEKYGRILDPDSDGSEKAPPHDAPHRLDAGIAYLTWKIQQKERLLEAQRRDLADLIARRDAETAG